MTEPAIAEKLSHLRTIAALGGLEIDEYVLPDDRHLVVDGHRLHYLDWSAAEGARDVVLLHGGGLTAHTWDLVCLALRPTYRCLALDQRGHGDSEWSPNLDYSRDAHVRDIEGFVDQLELDDFVLIGMSLGGLNAIEYAARHSRRLKGLVLIDAGPAFRAAGAKRIRDFMSGNTEFDSVDDVIQHAMTFNAKRKPELLRVSLMHNLRKLPSGKWTWKYDPRPRVSQEQLDAARRALTSRIPAIGCPALVVRGAESDVFTEEQAATLAADLPSGRWVQVENAGHTVQGDNPRGLVEALRTFFADVRV